MRMKHMSRLQNLLIALLAMASLFASSVSACTCSHHPEQAETETDSCHAHSHHEDASADQTQASLQSVESQCECVLAKPAPAAIAKSSKRNVSVQPDASHSELFVPSFQRAMLLPAVFAKITRSNSNFLSKHLESLIPARAPPRL
jgi:hypothetical protein